MKTNVFSIVLILLIFLLLAPLQGTALYVDISISSSGSGLSWTSPYKYLQDALTAAVFGDVIHVAQGIYYTDETASIPSGTGIRTTFFVIPLGVTVLGGYPTGGGVRNWQTNPTTLSADIGTVGTNTDNAYHVVVFPLKTTNNSVLDGFVIQDGYANGTGATANGGGIFINGQGLQKCAPAVNNCEITKNHANLFGGGIYIFSTVPTHVYIPPIFENCIIHTNTSSQQGGGLLNLAQLGISSPIFNHCMFYDNTAVQAGGGIVNYAYNFANIKAQFTECEIKNNLVTGNNVGGGGVFNRAIMEAAKCNPVFSECKIQGNVSNGSGGGIMNESLPASYTNPEFINCLVTGNDALGFGGAIFNECNNSVDCSPTFKSCTIANNKGFPGGIVNSVAISGICNPIFKNTIIWNNFDPGGGNDVVNLGSASATYMYSDIDGSGGSSAWNIIFGTDGGSNIDTDPLFINPIDPINAPPSTLGDYDISDYSPCIGAANATSSPATDIEYITRGTPPDIGAYENERYDQSLPVELATFTAEKTDLGVLIRWTTESEVNNAGFNLYRSKNSDASYEKINNQLIKGAINSSVANDYEYLDNAIENGNNYFYKLEDVDLSGQTEIHDPISIMIMNQEKTITQYTLYNPYPNPFNPKTLINFDIPRTDQVTITIYDIQGKPIFKLLDKTLPPGHYSVEWNAVNINNQPVSAGLYFYEMKTSNGIVKTEKMMLVK